MGRQGPAAEGIYDSGEQKMSMLKTRLLGGPVNEGISRYFPLLHLLAYCFERLSFKRGEFGVVVRLKNLR